jgi:hypothetical protein
VILWASVCGRRAGQVERRQSEAGSEAHPKRNAAAAPQTEAGIHPATAAIVVGDERTRCTAERARAEGRQGTTRSP